MNKTTAAILEALASGMAVEFRQDRGTIAVRVARLGDAGPAVAQAMETRDRLRMLRDGTADECLGASVLAQLEEVFYRLRSMADEQAATP